MASYMRRVRLGFAVDEVWKMTQESHLLGGSGQDHANCMHEAFTAIGWQFVKQGRGYGRWLLGLTGWGGFYKTAKEQCILENAQKYYFGPLQITLSASLPAR